MIDMIDEWDDVDECEERLQQQKIDSDIRAGIRLGYDICYFCTNECKGKVRNAVTIYDCKEHNFPTWQEKMDIIYFLELCHGVPKVVS